MYKYEVIRHYRPFILSRAIYANEYSSLFKANTLKEADKYWNDYKENNGEFFGITGPEGYYLITKDKRVKKVYRTYRAKYNF